MKNIYLKAILTGASFLIVMLAVVSFDPAETNAGGYGYNYGGYGGYSYSGGYSYGHGGGYYHYPPAPSPYTIPVVQTVYHNGYYYNNYVPTVRYFPPAYVYQHPYWP